MLFACIVIRLGQLLVSVLLMAVCTLSGQLRVFVRDKSQWETIYKLEYSNNELWTTKSLQIPQKFTGKDFQVLMM